MGEIKSFEDLEVWGVGRTVKRDRYDLAKGLPQHEQYNLAQQIRTAALSLTANLAEGLAASSIRKPSSSAESRGARHTNLSIILLVAKIWAISSKAGTRQFEPIWSASSSL